jgi:GxxExxY protein
MEPPFFHPPPAIRVHPWRNPLLDARLFRYPSAMDREGKNLKSANDTHAILGCAMEVLNSLGHGLVEKPYENALVVEFGLRCIPFRQQPRFAVLYKGIPVGEFVPDLIAFDRVVVDPKSSRESRIMNSGR